MIVLRPCAVRHTFRLYIGFTAGRPPLLSVLAAALHLPIVGTWRTRKALGVPYDGPGWGDFYEPRVTRGGLRTATGGADRPQSTLTFP